MNNIHDMGGMHGFGPIPIEENEPVFHTDWEAKALGLTVAMSGWRKWNLDRSRFAREQLPTFDYLQFTYYERWIAALANLMVETGLVREEELATGKPMPGTAKATPPLTGADVAGVLAKGGPVDRKIDTPPAFRAGDAVKTVNENPKGHTRLPRYARGRSGEIVMHHGAHVFPDSNARGDGEAPQHLYSVRFSARELWGADASARDGIMLDLWESYLRPNDV
ncbi:MAG: nitrile hydratase subunit beta [Hyphomicrobiaceae bacterium]